MDDKKSSFLIGKFKEFFSQQDKLRKFIIVLGTVGIALIFASSFLKQNTEKKAVETNLPGNMESYAKNLEENIKSIVAEIKGAGNAKVLVTLESSQQTIYATEQKKNKEATHDNMDGETRKIKESHDIETKYIKIKDANGAEQALSVTQLQPSVKGVVVVCEGGDNKEVQEKVRDAVKTALNITSKRVFVTK